MPSKPKFKKWKGPSQGKKKSEPSPVLVKERGSKGNGAKVFLTCQKWLPIKKGFP